MYWLSKNGDLKLIADIETRHLCNIYRKVLFAIENSVSSLNVDATILSSDAIDNNIFTIATLLKVKKEIFKTLAERDPNFSDVPFELLQARDEARKFFKQIINGEADANI